MRTLGSEVARGRWGWSRSLCEGRREPLAAYEVAVFRCCTANGGFYRHLSRSGSAVQLECLQMRYPRVGPGRGDADPHEQAAVGVGTVGSVAAVLAGKEQLANLKVQLLGVGDEVRVERRILAC